MSHLLVLTEIQLLTGALADFPFPLGSELMPLYSPTHWVAIQRVMSFLHNSCDVHLWDQQGLCYGYG